MWRRLIIASLALCVASQRVMDANGPDLTVEPIDAMAILYLYLLEEGDLT